MPNIKNSKDTISTDQQSAKKDIVADLHLETAKIPWVELQRFFAGGKLLLLDSGEDMLDVASSLVSNDVTLLQGLIDQEKIVHPSDDMARQWVEQDATLWAVVLNPWVLVQEEA